MCDLLAISAEKPIDANPYLSEVVERRRILIEDEDGWGIAFHNGEKVILFREPQPAWQSDLFLWLRDRRFIKTRMLILHIRKATTGNVSWWNTHPFKILCTGREYVFAHKGDVSNKLDRLKLRLFKPSGDTDSERLFLYIVENFCRGNLLENIQELKEFSDEIAEGSRLNYVLSDGDKLVVYDGVDDEPIYYKIEENYVVAASEKLRGKNWRIVGVNKMLVIKDGKLLEIIS